MNARRLSMKMSRCWARLSARTCWLLGKFAIGMSYLFLGLVIGLSMIALTIVYAILWMFSYILSPKNGL